MTLTVHRIRELLSYDPETGDFVWLVNRRKVRAGSIAGRTWTSRRDGHQYREIRIAGRDYLAHRLAWLLTYGQWPSECIDHVNGDGLDNRLANLREATNSQNQCNKRHQRHNAIGLKGVSFDRLTKKWRARIMVHGRDKHLGRFPTAELAHAAYCAAAADMHGEFARTS